MWVYFLIFKNGYVKVILRSNATLNREGYCIKENRKLLDLIANTLLQYETITKEQITYLVEHGCMPDEDETISTSDFEEASLEDLSVEELRDLAKDEGLLNADELDKEDLITFLTTDLTAEKDLEDEN